MKNLLSQIRLSIEYGYLPTNWHENKESIILCESGYYSLTEDCININGNLYNENNDSDDYFYDDYEGKYVEGSNYVEAIGKRGEYCVTHEDNCIEYRNTYYITEYASDNDIVYLEDTDTYTHIDNAYYHEYDGYYSYPPDDDDDDDDDDILFDYSSKQTRKLKGSSKYFIGFEIEKNEMPNFTFNKHDLLKNEGCSIERDSSVSSGFELVTPAYNLSLDIESKFDSIKDYLNIQDVSNAGGHISFSHEDKSGEELIDELKVGWLPLIYAMYRGRLNNHYCSGKSVDSLKCDKDKYQAIRINYDYIEFRLVSAVKNVSQLKWRLGLFRLIAKQPKIKLSQLIGELLSPHSEIHNHFALRYDTSNLNNLVKHTIGMTETYNFKKLSNKTITKITNKTNLQCA